MKIEISVNVKDLDQIKEIVKKMAEIEKEHRPTCTLELEIKVRN